MPRAAPNGTPPEDPSKMMPGRNRKRRRPGSLAVLTCALALKPVTAFLPANDWATLRETHFWMTRTSTEHSSRELNPPAQAKRGDDGARLARLFLLESVAIESSQNDGPTTAAVGEFKRRSQPPWLQCYYELGEENAITHPFPLKELQELEALLTKNGFSFRDVQEIRQTIFFYCAPSVAPSHTFASPNSLLRGMIDYVSLIVAEHSHFQSLDNVGGSSEGGHSPTGGESRAQILHCHVFASKPVILAGIVHFAECVAAPEDGIYDHVKRSIHGINPYSSTSLPVPPLSGDEEPQAKGEGVVVSEDRGRPPRQRRKSRRPRNLPVSSLQIAASAANIKRAEILARAILGVGRTRRLSKAEAEGLQGLLLSSMEDWRALALRCVASLFRLEGILHRQQQWQPLNDEDPAEQANILLPGLRSPEIVHTAQEAILVYATLAQRLGMHQLKAKIEEKAFRILYQRQYKAVASVYQQNVDAMQVVQSHLSTQIDALLRSDEFFMAHVERLEVSSRVKEPYSFWKKLLKTKAKQKQKQKLSLLASPSSNGSGGRTASDLSLAQVQDAIALRVVLKAKREDPDELDETTRAREKLLCYYAQHLIRKQWPGDDERVKDYIQYPKPNGYQSLHYTAWLSYYTGQHFPFEVQVRSEEMHRIAEYGVAAHWDYKLAYADRKQRGEKGTLLALNAADESSEDDHLVSDEEVEPVVQEPTERQLVLDPLSASFHVHLKESFPALNGNTMAPGNEDMIDLEAAEKYSRLLNDSTLHARGKNRQVEYIEALESARESLVRQRVYVFVAGSSSLTMEQGHLLILESGSSIRDAFECIKLKSPEMLETLVEEPMVSVGSNVSVRPSQSKSEPSIWRNGRQAQMDDIVRNGDVLLLEL